MQHASFSSVSCKSVGTLGGLGCARHGGARHVVLLVGSLKYIEIVTGGKLRSSAAGFNTKQS